MLLIPAQPTSALVAVPDARLKVLASMAKSVAVVPKQIRFVDIAGLIRGASEGNGLGMLHVLHSLACALMLFSFRQ
jgi:ribosome-binding ATPase YchF (GTP1/OBG family)